MPKGKALKYSKPDLLLKRGLEYIQQRNKEKKPVLYSGMLLWLGLSRSSFLEYGKRRGYGEIVDTLKTYIQKDYEELLHSGKPVGAIFALKQFGWKDEEVATNTKPLIVKWVNPRK